MVTQLIVGSRYGNSAESREAGMVQWRERSSSTNVARSEGFSPDSPVFLLPNSTWTRIENSHESQL